LQWLYKYVAMVCSQCFICVFRRMLQVFLSRYCICFTHMLQVFHVEVAYVFEWLHTCSPSVSNVYCKCFNYFGRMLPVLHLNVVKVDLVLHMLQWDPSVAHVCCS
jgi:hypothetical protein